MWSVARKRGMPKGHSMADIAADYADLIIDEFGGQVDLVVGISFGGMVGSYLAADHPDRFGHIALIAAGYAVGERGKALDSGFARHLSEGRNGEAMATMLRDLGPRWLGSTLAGLLGALAGRFAFGDTHPEFASDVLVEAEAEVSCDARDALPRISVPVLLVCGDRVSTFPRTSLRRPLGSSPIARCGCTQARGTCVWHPTSASPRTSSTSSSDTPGSRSGKPSWSRSWPVPDRGRHWASTPATSPTTGEGERGPRRVGQSAGSPGTRCRAIVGSSLVRRSTTSQNPGRDRCVRASSRPSLRPRMSSSPSVAMVASTSIAPPRRSRQEKAT